MVGRLSATVTRISDGRSLLMGYPWGMAPVKVGEVPAPEVVDVLQGTTPADMQRIIGAQYMNNGIIPNGGLSVEGTSSMAYKVNAGAAFMWTSSAAKTGIIIPVETQTVNTVPAPATGSRTDVVYVDTQGVVHVAQASTHPTGIQIAKFTVPAGITATTAAQQSINRSFAVPTGGALGRMAHWTDPGGGAATMQESVKTVQRFALPSDRLVEIRVTTTMRSVASPGSMYFDMILESPAGSVRRRLDVAHTPDWDTRSATWSFGTGAGENILTVKTVGTKGGTWQFSSGGSVTEVSLWDQGVLR